MNQGLYLFFAKYKAGLTKTINFVGCCTSFISIFKVSAKL